MRKNSLISIILVVLLVLVVIALSDFIKFVGKYTFLEQNISSDVVVDGALIQFPAGIAFILMDVEIEGLRLRCANFTRLRETGALTFSVSRHSKDDSLFY
jgi:hypothetical protein